MVQKRFMGVDLGSKRIGIALSDPLNIISQSYTTLMFKGKKKLVQDLDDIINEKNVGTVIFGIPLTLSGEESKKTKEVKTLIQFIEAELESDVDFDYEDESMTTVRAHDIMRQMGKKPSKNKDRVDQIAAQQILSQYMERFG